MILVQEHSASEGLMLLQFTVKGGVQRDLEEPPLLSFLGGMR